MLLRSRPDMVHRFLLRKTQISTPVCPGSDYMQCPKQNITPAIADFRFRGPLLPRLHGGYSIIIFLRFVNQIPFTHGFVCKRRGDSRL